MNIELNQKTHLKDIYNFLEMAIGIKLNPPRRAEGEIELNRKPLCASELPKRPVCKMTETAKGTKLKLAWEDDRSIELYQKILF